MVSRNRLCLTYSILGIVVSSCSSVGYLSQATRGQLQLSNRQKPLSEVIESPTTPESVRKILLEIPEIKKFGESFGLTPTKNYETYVALDQPYVSYIVTASHPLQFEPKIWKFPIVGSFTYLGWFKESDAHNMAKQLISEGWDVDVRGATAYSTLGYFKDPILSSMLNQGYSAVVEVILHESVHSTFYLEEQSTFNETLAEFVAVELTTHYLKNKNRGWVEKYLTERKRNDQITSVLHETYQNLEDLYRQNISDSEKQSNKMVLLEKLDERLTREFAFKSRKGSRYFWNNASLLQYRTYDVAFSAFEKGFREVCKQNWNCFWKKIQLLKKDKFPVSQMTDPSPVIAQIFIQNSS